MPRYKYLGPLIASAGFRVVAMNLRGFGGSTGKLEGATFRDYANDVVGIIEKLGATKAHLIGWAGGNRIQRMVAVTHPSRVSSVVLLAAGGSVGPALAPDLLKKGGLIQVPGALTPEERLVVTRAIMFSPATPDERVQEFVDSLDETWPEAVKAHAEAARSTPNEVWWSGGDSQLLIVQGLDDKMAPVENGRKMKEMYGDRIELVELSGCGHMMAFERPQACADAITAFFRKCELQPEAPHTS